MDEARTQDNQLASATASAEPVEALRLRLFRLVAVVGCIIYPLFWLVLESLAPPSFDPLWLRLVISGLFLAFLAATYLHPHALMRRVEPLWAGLGLLLTGHMLLLTYRNAMNPVYLAGAFAIFVCVGALLNSAGAVMYLAFGSILVSLLGLTLQPVGQVVLVLLLFAVMALVGVLAASWRERATEALTAALQSLQRSEERFRHMTDTMPALIWTTNAQGVTTYVNQTWRNYTGVHQPLPYAELGALLVHPDDLARALETYEEASSAPGRACFEMAIRLRREDGVFRWILARGSPRYDAAGRFQGYTCSGVDISGRMEAVAAREEKEDLYHAITDTAADGIFTVDDEGTILFANGAAERTFGQVGGRPLIGTHLSQLLPDELGKKVMQILRGSNSTEIAWRTHDEVPRSFEARFAQASRNGRGVYIGIVRDVSARLRAESERDQLQARIAVSSQLAALGEMAAGIAHEISNPLTILSGQADRLGRALAGVKPDLTAVRQTADTIAETTARIAGIVKGMRTLSRQGRDQDPFTTVDVLDPVDEAVALVREAYRTAKVDLRLDVPEGLTLQCRPTQLSQVLVNLLGNALDAVKHLGDDERWAEIDATAHDHWIELTITDGGPGLPAELRDKVFQPFFTTKKVGEGTGLGLSISRAIVEVHGGTIRTDAAGGHTRFVLELPKEPPRLPPLPRPSHQNALS